MAISAWYYNSASGAVQKQQQWIAYPELHLGLDWHGPFKTKQEALDYYTKNKANNPGWKAPTGVGGTIANATGLSAAGDALTNKLGLSNENITSWLIRIGEILLGIVLVGVGIAKLTGTTNVVASAVKARI